jgi:SAM-dependent methyltransferase
MDAAAAATLAAHVAELARTLASRGPAPAAQPGFGLESASGTSALLLDTLSGHGIFRKYERVLTLADALGGVGRWLALRRGCTALVVTADATSAAGGAVLTRRAGLRRQVQHLVAAADGLPIATDAVTHVWIVEQLPRVADAGAVLREARRVLRPGGHLGVQDLVCTAAHPAPLLAGWRFAEVAERVAQLRDAGFVDVDVRHAGAAACETSALVTAARARLQAQLAGTAAGAAIAAERVALGDAVRDGGLDVVQLVARNP